MTPLLSTFSAASAQGFGFLRGTTPQIQFLGTWSGLLGSSYDITVPDTFGFSFGGLLQNDLLIVVTGFAGIFTPNGNPGVTTAGFTEVADLYAGTNRTINTSVSYKVMGATPDSTISVNTGGSLILTGILGFRNVNTVSPLDATTTTATAAGNLNVDGAAITTVTDNAVVVTVGQFAASTANPGFGPPSVNIEASSFGTFVGSGGILVYLGTTYSVNRVSPAGVYNVAAWSQNANTAGSWAAGTVAIRPIT
jgi:hypothetical protein